MVSLVVNVISWTNRWWQRPPAMRVMLRIGTLKTCPSLCLTLRAPHATPSYRTCQLGIRFSWTPGSSAFNSKYSNSATQLLGNSVAQLVRAWQAICQVVGSSRALSHCHFFLGTRQLSAYRILSTCAVVLASCARRRGRRNLAWTFWWLVLMLNYDRESSFHDLKGYKSWV